MNEAERIGRAHRAKSAWDEFVGPMLGEMRSEYTSRIVEIANTELNSAVRADKLTTLSNALRILDTLESGMQAHIFDGEVARKAKIRADEIENMSNAQKRLLRMTGY